MVEIAFTDNLLRHLPCPPTRAGGKTVRAVMEAVFAQNPPLRSYIVDDQGRLRRHVNIFVNDAMVSDRSGLTDPVAENDRVFVFQALSGG